MSNDTNYLHQKKLEAEFKNGVQNGLQREWFENGQISFEAVIKDEKPVGQVKEWDIDGNPV